MRKISLPVAAGLVLGFAGPAMAQNPCAPMAEMKPLQAVYDNFTAAYNAGDAHALAALYTEDASTMYANNTRKEGAMDIAMQFEEAFGAGAQLVLHPGDAKVMGDVAVDNGHYVVTMDVEGETQTQSGYWMGVYKMVDGEWKIVKGISNSDQPSP